MDSLVKECLLFLLEHASIHANGEKAVKAQDLHQQVQEAPETTVHFVSLKFAPPEPLSIEQRLDDALTQPVDLDALKAQYEENSPSSAS